MRQLKSVYPLAMFSKKVLALFAALLATGCAYQAVPFSKLPTKLPVVELVSSDLTDACYKELTTMLSQLGTKVVKNGETHAPKLTISTQFLSFNQDAAQNISARIYDVDYVAYLSLTNLQKPLKKPLPSEVTVSTQTLLSPSDLFETNPHTERLRNQMAHNLARRILYLLLFSL